MWVGHVRRIHIMLINGWLDVELQGRFILMKLLWKSRIYAYFFLFCVMTRATENMRL